MAQDTLLGFPAHTLPYRRGEFTVLLTASSPELRSGLFPVPKWKQGEIFMKTGNNSERTMNF